MNTFIEYTKWLAKWFLLILVIGLTIFTLFYSYDKYQKKLFNKFVLHCSDQRNPFIPNKAVIDNDSYIVFKGKRSSDKPTYAIYYYNNFKNSLTLTASNMYSKMIYRDRYYFDSDSIKGVRYKFEINRENLDMVVSTSTFGHKEEVHLKTESCKKISFKEFENEKYIFSKKLNI